MRAGSRTERRAKRHRRIRRKVVGTAGRPRMAIMVSNKNIRVQFIDDDKGVTLASATTVKLDVAPNCEAAAALAKGIKQVVVDRGGFRYAGRVRALTEAVLEAGLSTSAAAGDAPEPANDDKKES